MHNPRNVRIGEFIKSYRVLRGLSVRQLAVLCGPVVHQTIYNWEREKYSVFKKDLERLSSVLRVPLPMLLAHNRERPKAKRVSVEKKSLFVHFWTKSRPATHNKAGAVS